ncbi:aspartyl protease family protein At5g10770 isoform X2 [Asparagus officinalis]|uniref:aspartyl protease family protein At5g10770 isoform X2 n=1 Tax=Asparagus officinalis TaxID=4686 RepID=UPI00098E709D|nr:aspartyl protease family protein At5g10770 isoform X2 [Asparagus officinalis]
MNSGREKDAIVLEMRHHSTSWEPTPNQEDKLQMIMVSDEARVSYLLSRMNKISSKSQQGSSKAQIPLTSGRKLQTLNYIVNIELGSRKMTVIVDTGSDLTWIQCQPCQSCYNQQDPIFDPSTSLSYQPIQCNSPTCHSLQVSTGDSSNCSLNHPSCTYAISYGDGSYTRGILARDQIKLAGTVIEGFAFGCGQNNRGLFGGTSGLMGLAQSELSLVSQTTDQFGGFFSYCLPTKEFDSSGALVLGSDSSSYRNSTPVVYTRMILDPNQSPFYFLNLTGMSIGGVSLQASGFLSGKILIDSGTVITRLVPSIYKAVKDEFLEQFSQYPSVPGFSILDTCFDLSGKKEVNIPTVKLEFESAVEVEVDVSGVFYFVKSDASQVCLAFTGLSYEDEVGIIGNYQQKNLRVVYDTMGSRLGFAEETCGYN